MRYRILGPLEVRDGPRVIALPQGRQPIVLALLLVHANQVVGRDRLIDALWGESPPSTALHSLHNVVSALRKGLGDALATRDGGYVLQVAAGELDADVFEALAQEASGARGRGETERAAELLREALGLWRGPALGELAYHIALADEAARLDEARLTALEERVDAELACGRHADVVAELEGLVAQHPLRERLRAQHVLALYRRGRQADALASYRDARRHLNDELGIEPGPALRRLEQAVLAQDPELGAPDGLPDAPRAVAWARRHAGALIVAGTVAVVAAVLPVVVGGHGEDASERAAAMAHDYLAVVDARTDRVVARHAVGTTPSAVAVGGGAAWSVNADAGTVSRVDLRTGAGRTVDLGSVVPLDVAAGADAAWVVGGRSSSDSIPRPETIVRLDVATGAPVQERSLGPHGVSVWGAGPQIVAATDGAAWVIGSTGTLIRIDARTRSHRRFRRIHAQKVAAGDGQLWVIADKRPGPPPAPELLRLDPRTGSTLAHDDAPARTVGTLAIGDGAVWVTDDLSGTVWRVDPDGVSKPRPIPVAQGIDAIAAADGSVWVANSLAGTVARIDPRRNAVTRELGIGATPRGIAAAGDQVWISGAGAAQSAQVAASLPAGARVRPISSPDCTPVLTGSDRDPDFLVVFDDLFEGGFLSQVEAVHDAIAFVMREHEFRAGRFTLGLQRCNDALQQTGFFDPAKCRANARAYVRNASVIGVLGPSHSDCAAAMLPVLNSAPGGPLPLVSEATTHPEIVRRETFVPAGLLSELYPTGQRGYARIMPSDDYEMAATAIFAKRLSPSGPFVIRDNLSGPYPMYFRRAARRLGLPIRGTAKIDASAPAPPGLAARIRASGARVVYLQTGGSSFLRTLRPELGDDIAVINSAFGGITLSRFFDEAGAAARGAYVTFGGRPVERLTPAGRAFVHRFAASRPGRVANWAVYGAAAAEVLLDAIARSDGTRASVTRALARVDLRDTAAGPMSFKPDGEPTRNPITVVRAEHGGEPEDGALAAGGRVVTVIEPPERLVGVAPGR